MSEIIFRTEPFTKAEPLSPEQAKTEKELHNAFLSDVPVEIPGRNGRWRIMSSRTNHDSLRGYSEIVFTGEAFAA